MNTATATALYARKTAGFDERVEHARQLLARAAEAHPGRIVQASSLGAEDQVLTDLIARDRLPIAIATLDTGMLHGETLALIDAVRARYSVFVERYGPVREAVVAFVGRHGADAMRQSVDLRQACCAIRKVEPLGRMLAGRTAWVTGLRREQSNERAEIEFESGDDAGRTKLSPLADWSWTDVWHYLALNDVPYNALHDQFFPSIGCAPCTRAVAVGEDFRAGRWWWEQGAKECGLHVGHANELVPALPT
ncbi:MAG: phosphoadenylyl-sulfate reductase [Pseudomonadota bacterium]|nr:phosphoadenylyl-sulfate reductase [Pseudomonadota bacterium]